MRIATGLVAGLVVVAVAAAFLTSPVLAACGKASFYCCEHHGRLTASGERFNQNAMTAAHMSLPFGTVVNVRNVQNGRSVQVRITDRGNFAKYGRIIDLSRGAFAKLAPTSRGVISVCVERVR